MDPTTDTDKAGLAKTLKGKRDALQAESAELRSVASQIGRDLTDSEKKVIAENDATIAAAEADIAALEKTPATYDDQIKALQEQRADLVEASRAIARTGKTRDLTDDERRTVQGNDTLVAEIDHKIGLLEREKVDNLPPAERVTALQEERDALAKADADSGTKVNSAAIARLDAAIADANAEVAAQGAKP